MLYSGTDPKSYITEYTLVYEKYLQRDERVRAAPCLRPLLLRPVVLPITHCYHLDAPPSFGCPSVQMTNEKANGRAKRQERE